MKLNKICLFICVAVIGLEAGPDRINSAKTVVEDFSASEQRTPEILRALARQAHVPIGMIGELVGSDSKLITVAGHQTSIKRLLEDICAQDPRYTWRETADGTILVEVGKNRLSLLNVQIEKVDISTRRPADLVMLLTRQEQIKDWTEKAGCRLGQVVTGPMTDYPEDVNISESKHFLWQILTEISRQTKTYFWSVVKYSIEPCAININP